MSIFECHPSIINEYPFILHKELIKLYKDPEVIQLLTENLYNMFLSISNIEKFVFNDTDMYFEFTVSNIDSSCINNNDIVRGIHSEFCGVIAQISANPNYEYIFKIPYTLKVIIDNPQMKGLFLQIVSSAVTVLPLTNNDSSSKIFKINLHN